MTQEESWRDSIMLTDPKLRAQVDALWDKFWTGGLSNPLDAMEEFAGVVAWVESLPLAAKRLGDFVRGRMGASQSAWQVEELFESLLAEAYSN